MQMFYLETAVETIVSTALKISSVKYSSNTSWASENLKNMFRAHLWKKKISESIVKITRFY